MRESVHFEFNHLVLQNGTILSGNKSGSLFTTSVDLSSKNKINSPAFKNIRFIDYGVDSNKVFIASDDLGIYTFDLEKEKICSEIVLEGHLDIITGLDCLHQRPLILTSSLDGTVRFWDTRNGEGKILLESKEVDIWAVKYYEALDKVVVGDGDGNLGLIDYK